MQFMTQSNKKNEVKVQESETNNVSKHWRTPGVSGTMNKTAIQSKYNRFGDSDISMNSLRSKKYSRISNKAYM
jgi:hypothetical protein